MKMMKFLSGAALASLLLTFSSCDDFDLGGLLGGGDQDGEENIGGGDLDDILPGERPGTATLLTPSEQKAKLDEVGREVLEKCPSDDVKDLFQLYDAVENEYIDRDDEYNIDAIADFGEKVIEDSYEEDVNYNYNAARKQYVRESTMNVVVALANHKGDFTFGRDSVTRDRRSTFDGVRVNIPLRDKNYQVTLETSGKTTTAYYKYRYESEYAGNDGYYDQENDRWVSVEGGVTEINKGDFTFSIEVPENINLSITENGAPYATVSIKSTQSFTAAGLDPSVDNFNYDVTVFLSNGYEVFVKDVAYDGSKGQAGGGVVVKKDGESLVSAVIAGKASVENCTGSDEWDDGMSKDEYTSIKVNYAKDIDILMDIIAQVQIKGTCSDAKELYESYDAFELATEYWDWETGNRKNPDKTAAARHINNINAKLDLALYYDLDYTKKQASVEFELGEDNVDWDINGDGRYDNSDVDYYLRPVIVFNDNSRYSIEEYFTEEAFEVLLESAEDFADGYVKLFDEYIGISKKQEEVMPGPDTYPSVGEYSATR